MHLRRRLTLADERGTTLIEMLVALTAGLVIFGAVMGLVVTTLHSSARVSARVHATQRARIVLTRVMEELHSACIAPEIAPIREKSTGTLLRFVHQTGSDVQPTPILSEISLSGTTLSQADYPWASGTAPNWTFAEKASSTRTLLTGVSPISPSTSIFSYYAYSSGTISPTPQATPLEATAALLTVQVRAAMTVAPENTPVKDSGASVSIRNTATLRLTPPSFNEGSPSRPCQ
jgi:Tfp pilus assembly protein PilW